jgi:succinate dehydrogenase/fumarate reductase cytochrome b subunit
LGVPAIGLVATGTQWSDAMATIQSANISPELIQSAKFFVTFPFVYHTFNGVRHLVCRLAAVVSAPAVTTFTCTIITIVLDMVLMFPRKKVYST